MASRGATKDPGRFVRTAPNVRCILHTGHVDLSLSHISQCPDRPIVRGRRLTTQNVFDAWSVAHPSHIWRSCRLLRRRDTPDHTMNLTFDARYTITHMFLMVSSDAIIDIHRYSDFHDHRPAVVMGHEGYGSMLLHVEGSDGSVGSAVPIPIPPALVEGSEAPTAATPASLVVQSYQDKTFVKSTPCPMI